MTETETIKILALLNAYYGQGKAEPETMANAWHMLLKDYDYKTVEGAVLNFAREDKREYPVFPSVGQILESIRKEENLCHAIWGRMANNDSYDELSPRAQRLITEDQFYSMQEKKESFYDDRDKGKFIEWLNRGNRLGGSI